MRYSRPEIERIAHVAFQAARKRNKKVTSVDKANVLETFQFWKDVVTEVHKDYPDVELEHMYVDNAAMQLVQGAQEVRRDRHRQHVRRHPVGRGCHADRLDRHAAQSASLDKNNKGLYEPSHGCAPDIAGKGIANPLATILSAAMMLKFSLNQPEAAARIESAVPSVLAQGLRTADIWSEGTQKVSTREMGDAVVAAILAGKTTTTSTIATTKTIKS